MIRLDAVVSTLPAGFDALQAEARTSGHRMLETLAAEWASGTTCFDRPGEALLAAYVGDELAGIGGITFDPVVPGALRMRRFYVSASHRRAGIGRALGTALLAAPLRQKLTVFTNAAAGSEAFWESLGFVPDRREGHTHRLG